MKVSKGRRVCVVIFYHCVARALRNKKVRIGDTYDMYDVRDPSYSSLTTHEPRKWTHKFQKANSYHGVYLLLSQHGKFFYMSTLILSTHCSLPLMQSLPIVWCTATAPNDSFHFHRCHWCKLQRQRQSIVDYHIHISISKGKQAQIPEGPQLILMSHWMMDDYSVC